MSNRTRRFAMPRAACRAVARPAVWPATGAGVSLDAATLAFVAARTAEGETWTAGMKTALDTFIADQKAASRWDKIKRLYLPTSGIAAANAICLRTLTAGTWAGTVTHSTGYATGNGTNGFLNMGADIAAMAITSSDFSFGFLAKQAPTGTGARCFLGVFNSGTAYFQMGTLNGTTARLSIGNYDNFAVALTRANTAGVHMASRAAGNNYWLRRVAAGTSYPLDAAVTAGGTVPTGNVYAMALNQVGASPANQAHNDAQFGAIFTGLAMSKADAEAFTADLATLWETLTGLALP